VRVIGLRLLKLKLNDLVEMHRQKRAAAASDSSDEGESGGDLKSSSPPAHVPIAFERLSDPALHELLLFLRTSDALPAATKQSVLSSLQSVYPDMYASLLLSPLTSSPDHKPPVSFLYLPRKYVCVGLAAVSG
jgi:hypothetical protein